MQYLLDTNIISFWMKGKCPGISDKLKEVPAQEIGIPAIVYGELLYGLYQSTNKNKLDALIESFAAAFRIVPYEEKAARKYGEIRARLKSQGTLIGSNDMLIAAVALAENAVLVTNNTKEFSRIEGLKIEDWSI